MVACLTFSLPGARHGRPRRSRWIGGWGGPPTRGCGDPPDSLGPLFRVAGGGRPRSAGHWTRLEGVPDEECSAYCLRGCGGPLGVAGHRGGQVPAQDSVVGGGSFNGFIDSSHDVRSGPSGENPIGETSVTFPGGSVSASSSIDCWSSTAIPPPSRERASRCVLLLSQNHRGGQRLHGAPPDTIAVSGFNAPPGCSEPLDPVLSYPLNGDIVVTDAQPFPTSKDECKNGGWRNFARPSRTRGSASRSFSGGPKT